MSIEKFTAPSAWASYLVNGDASGIDELEVEAADAFVRYINMGAPVDVADIGFSHTCDAANWGLIDPLAGDMAEYTFFDGND